MTKLCSRQAEIAVKITIKGNNSKTVLGTVMVLLYCAPYYINKYKGQVSSQPDQRWQIYAPDKDLDAARSYIPDKELDATRSYTPDKKLDATARPPWVIP